MNYPNLRNLIQPLLNTVEQAFHPHCAFCGLPRTHPAHLLCEACYAELPWHTRSDDAQTYSAFDYQPPISNLLLGIKFGKNLRELSTLGQLTAIGIQHQIDEIPDAILPVPLHTARLRTRGFNQALELARPLAQQLGIPLLTRAVIRHKATQAQTELDMEARQHNLQQAFCLSAPLPHPHIAIFDDVITTGATTQELAALLHSQGVARVDIWSCARTILTQTHAAAA